MKVSYIAPKVYEFSGWLFEDCPASGPWPLRKDFTRRSAAGAKFANAYNEFSRLPESQKEQCRVCPHNWSYALSEGTLKRSCRHCQSAEWRYISPIGLDRTWEALAK